MPLGHPASDLDPDDLPTQQPARTSIAPTSATTVAPPVVHDCTLVAPGDAMPDAFDPAPYFVPAQPHAAAAVSGAQLLMRAPAGATQVAVRPVAGTDMVVVNRMTLSTPAAQGTAAAMLGALDRSSGLFTRQVALTRCNVHVSLAIEDDVLLVVQRGFRLAFELLWVDPLRGAIRWRWVGDGGFRHLSVLEDGHVFVAADGDRQPDVVGGTAPWALTTLDADSGRALRSTPVDVARGAVVVPSDAPDLHVIERGAGGLSGPTLYAVRRLDPGGSSSPAMTFPGFVDASDGVVPGAAIAKGAIWYHHAPGSLEARRLDTAALQASVAIGSVDRLGLQVDTGPTSIWVSGFVNGSAATLLQIDPGTAQVRATHAYTPPRAGMRHPQPVLVPFARSPVRLRP